jgi:hypothetical protein
VRDESEREEQGSEIDGMTGMMENMEVQWSKGLTYNGFFPKILMKASSTL